MSHLKRLLVDPKLCAGCRYCEMICSFKHEGKFSSSQSRVTVVKEDKFGMDFPVFCRHCRICPPSEVCPTNSFSRNFLGLMTVNYETCLGCGVCLESCPFGALKIGSSLRILICDLCGGSPVCVERCPTKALKFEESDEYRESAEKVFQELKLRWRINE